MNTTDLVYFLAFITLALAVGFGAWQIFRVQRAKHQHVHSALSDHPGAPPSAPTNKTMDGR